MKLQIATGNSRMEKRWNNVEMELDEFIERISHTIRTAETVEQYMKMTKAKQDAIKDVGGYVAGRLKGGRRKKDSVEYRTMIVEDMDHAVPGVIEQIEMLYNYRCLIYSTHKHTPENPRYRLAIPLSRPVSPDEYVAIARKVAEDIGIEMFDDTTYEPSRLMYWPSTSADGEFIFRDIEGEPLNPDDVLSRYKDWRDSSEWPVSSRQQNIVQREMRKQADPLTKDGVIGAFCRTYTIEDAIAAFLSDVYQPSTMPGRYDYIPADSQAGVVIYEGKFAYSHHATDPACGRLMNAFDMVRIHRFGEMDEKAAEDTEASKLPSFTAMSEFAVNDENVKMTIAGERMEKAEKEFSGENEDWQKELEYEKRSTVVKNTLRNLLLILNNDEKLKGIVFNQLSDGMEIKGEVPWEHPSRFWRDADDAQLISYVDLNYGTFSMRNYNIAVTKAADDRSYHPVREFLDALPEWDRVPRVDTLLIDYLGADDTPYVRAVTRKTLCGAVCRVLSPGCKFDTMLVLNGPQGVGKSTLISRLAGDWFSDSLNLSDTKDKTAAEKLQGYWIMEIGELAGLKKAEVETLRSFLSRQNDIYRASFGKRATPHLRQCVFFGTTNAEKGYLRDTTGNRRFWPVKTPGGSRRHSWELSGEDIRQIWAEVLVYVKAGERLYLDGKMEDTAKSEQREAMESDEREGLVREYLDTLLPEKWDDMDLFERRNFLHGEDFGKPDLKGAVRRMSVSNMEIWCECFGKERANLKRMDSGEISAIMARIGGWDSGRKKERISLYGPQWVYRRVPKRE